MTKRTLEDLDGQPLEGQRALVRVDFNVPLRDGTVADTGRIDATLPTIRWLRERGCRVVLLSHLGRPGGRADPACSLRPVVSVLERELGLPVVFLHDPAGEGAARETRRLPRGAVALGENTRFYPGEERNDAALAARFAALGDFFVNDCFGAAHRAHASTTGVAEQLKPAVAGLLLTRELHYLGDLLEHPDRPFIAILGGAKISGKIDVIRRLLPQVDRILVGGAMACTFFVAMGLEVGTSLTEPDRAALARELLEEAGDKLMLPRGAVVARALGPDAERRSVARNAIEPGWAVYDIDQATQQAFTAELRTARTVVWNGPMGVFETPPFDAGTLAVARAVAEATDRGATTVVGGGDSAAAVAAAGVSDRISHVSTGGGASLQLLEGRPLPAITVLDDR